MAKALKPGDEVGNLKVVDSATRQELVRELVSQYGVVPSPSAMAWCVRRRGIYTTVEITLDDYRLMGI